MSWLIDTNVISETRRPRPSSVVLSWLGSIDPSRLYLSVLTLAEIGRGIARLAPKEPARADMLRIWLDALAARHGRSILPIDRHVADRWAILAATRTLPVIDGFLLATALTHDLTFVSRDTSHARALGIAVIDPWESE